MKHRYYRFSDYFEKQGFQTKVYKVTVDAGFSCPNLDGTISKDGCIFCNNKSFSPASRTAGLSIEEQIRTGMERLKGKYEAEKFIVYFQAFSNTYGSIEKLKEIYDRIKTFENVVGLSIGTRPDCVNEKVLKLIDSYSKNYDVWIEYGLQSVHDRTLSKINRGHDYGTFLRAVNLTKTGTHAKICAHAIIGLPGESKEDVIATAKEIARLKLDAVKIHPLHVVKGTALEKWHLEKEYIPLKRDEFVELAVTFLEHLWPETVIQRLTADCPRELLVAPVWINRKDELLREIEEKLVEKNTFQGRLYSS